MSSETWELIQKMSVKDAELQLALQCAPLIAGLKVSNLLILDRSGMESVKRILSGSCISFFLLAMAEHKVTLLLYQEKKLSDYLAEERNREFLQRYGYGETDLQSILRAFWVRYQAHLQKKEDFPHEMGILLGYPVEDVEGFILHKGKNYLCAGYWKVYVNPVLKQQLFKKYDYAGENMVQLLSYGVKMEDIIEICG